MTNFKMDRIAEVPQQIRVFEIDLILPEGFSQFYVYSLGGHAERTFVPTLARCTVKWFPSQGVQCTFIQFVDQNSLNKWFRNFERDHIESNRDDDIAEVVWQAETYVHDLIRTEEKRA